MSQVPIWPFSLSGVEVGRGVGEVDNDIGQLVGIPGANGEQESLELGLARPGKSADVAEVKDGEALPVREQEVSGVRVGVVDAVPKNHLQVDVGSTPHQLVDVPARGGHAVTARDPLPGD